LYHYADHVLDNSFFHIIEARPSDAGLFILEMELPDTIVRYILSLTFTKDSCHLVQHKGDNCRLTEVCKVWRYLYRQEIVAARTPLHNTPS